MDEQSINYGSLNHHISYTISVATAAPPTLNREEQSRAESNSSKYKVKACSNVPFKYSIIPKDILQSFEVFIILCFIEGYLCSYTYMTRGKLLPNTQTANVVNTINKIFEKDAIGILTYILPNITFILGTLTSDILKEIYGKQTEKWKYWILFSQIILLTLMGFIPASSVPYLVNSLMAYSFGVQIQTYKCTLGLPLVVGSCDGNMRNFSESLVAALARKDSQSLIVAMLFAVSILILSAGVLMGRLVIENIPKEEKSIWVCSGILLVLLIYMVCIEKQKKKAVDASENNSNSNFDNNALEFGIQINTSENEIDVRDRANTAKLANISCDNEL